MRVTNLQRRTEAFRIEALKALDPVEVFVHVWEGYENACSITAICYGEAFTASFAAMGKPWREFVAGTSEDYLGNALVPIFVGVSERTRGYCRRIARAIIAAVRMMDDKWAQEVLCSPPPLHTPEKVG